ncbi:MAG: hypothetical protein H0W31_00140 [Actinobacteria bacterium]|nr:hypothetical protein [Actinomycetota bacterium]
MAAVTVATGSVVLLTGSAASVKAFPEAEGFGVDTAGGRGGKVIRVTSLSDSGPGTLRACMIASGPRICVFSVAGTIALQSSIEVSNPFLTVAGQTAPGGGITIRSAGTNEAAVRIKTHDVVYRYMRHRPGTAIQDVHNIGVNAGGTASGTNAAHNVVFDHVSVSWSGDEMVIFYALTHDVTMQHSLVAESLPAENLATAMKGFVLGSDNNPGSYTLHHNLVAHNNQRNPNVDIAGTLDWVNNVVYNWNFSGANLKLSPKVNFVGNYVKPGPNTKQSKTYVKLTTFNGGYFLSGNYADVGATFAPGPGVGSRYDAPQVTTDSAQAAYAKVLDDAGNSRGLDCAGSWFSRRDTVDARIVQSVKDGTRGHSLDPSINQGYIRSPADVGGWPALAAGTPCEDDDLDGMPNVWERTQGLDASNSDDSAADKDGDGYTNIEEYLNGPSGSAPPPPPPTTTEPPPTTTEPPPTTTEPAPACPTSGALALRIVSQTATTITLGWDPVPGADGYRFSSSQSTKRTNTWNGGASSVKFSKGASCYGVEALNVVQRGSHSP